MNGELEISHLISMAPELKQSLKQLVQELLNSDETERPALLHKALALVKENCRLDRSDPKCIEITGQIIEYLLVYLLSIRSAYESDYYQFLTLLNQLPVSTQSPYYQMLMSSLNFELQDNPERLNTLYGLLVLQVMTDIGDAETSQQMLADISPKISKKQIKLWTIYQLCRFSVLRMTEARDELLTSQLDIVIDTYHRDSPESAIAMLIYWIRKNNWGRHQDIKKALLMRLYNSVSEQRTLNSALVLYELFCMEDRLVSSAEKMVFQKKLIRLPSSILNIKQLQQLYFFAGNFNCGVQSKFKESIRNYQYSNYFLHKRWEQLLGMSQFLREHLQPEIYFQALPYLEKSIYVLSNQVSLQNNAYVESLQAGYDKIEELYDKVGELSLTDSLTGLRNRRYLDNNLPQLVSLANRHDVPVSLAMIDIDHFKKVNDDYGHLAGDYILRQLAKIITNQFRQSDVNIRYGGEEFLVVLFGLGVDKCYSMMEELRVMVQNHSFIYRNKVISITISIGVAAFEQDITAAPELSKLIGYSDKALYQAKNSGRNNVLVYRPRRRTSDSAKPKK